VLRSKARERQEWRRTGDYLRLKDNKEVYLLTIYDKSDFENVDDKTLRNIILSLNLNVDSKPLTFFCQ
jgi:hypothetical protein